MLRPATVTPARSSGGEVETPNRPFGVDRKAPARAAGSCAAVGHSSACMNVLLFTARFVLYVFIERCAQNSSQQDGGESTVAACAEGYLQGSCMASMTQGEPCPYLSKTRRVWSQILLTGCLHLD